MQLGIIQTHLRQREKLFTITPHTIQLIFWIIKKNSCVFWLGTKTMKRKYVQRKPKQKENCSRTKQTNLIHCTSCLSSKHDYCFCCALLVCDNCRCSKDCGIHPTSVGYSIHHNMCCSENNHDKKCQGMHSGILY